MPRHRMETLLHEWKRGGVGVLFLTVHYARRVHVREILRQCCLAPYSLISPLERFGDVHRNFCELMEGLEND